MRCFKALKNYRDFKVYSKNVLENKTKTDRIKKMRNVFQAWMKYFKPMKIKLDEEKF